MALHGAKELKQTLRSIRSGGRNAIRTATYAGARLLRDEERKAAPRATGLGVKKIIARREESRPGEGVATVGITRAGFYLRFRESGAAAHPIVLRLEHKVIDPVSRKTIRKEGPRRALAIGLGFGQGHGLIVFRRSVPRHPGVRGTRWFSRTLERQKQPILEVVRDSYAEQLTKQALKKGL